MAKTSYCTACGQKRPEEEGPNDTSTCTPCLIRQKTVEITKETCSWLGSVITPNVEHSTKMRLTFIIGRVYRKLCHAGFRDYLHTVEVEAVIKQTLTVLDA